MNSERGVYLSLAVAVVAVVLAIWGIWEARSAVDQAETVAARVDPVEAGRADLVARIDTLQGEVEELSQRVATLVEAEPPAPELDLEEPEELEEPEDDQQQGLTPLEPAPAE